MLLPTAGVPGISGPVLGTNGLGSVWGSALGLLVSWEPFDFGFRSALGFVCSHPGAIEVQAHDGHVWLSGRILAPELRRTPVVGWIAANLYRDKRDTGWCLEVDPGEGEYVVFYRVNLRK